MSEEEEVEEGDQRVEWVRKIKRVSDLEVEVMKKEGVIEEVGD